MSDLTHSYSAIKMYENCPHRYYRQRVLKDVLDKGSIHTEKGKEIHKAFELRLRDGVPLPEQLERFEPMCKSIEDKEGELTLEHQLTLNANLQPTDWFADDAYLRSVLDVLHRHDGKAAIIDWKTGKRRPDPFQLEMFAAQVFQHFPDINKVKTALVWVNTQEIDVFTYDRVQSTGMWQDILYKIKRIENSEKKNIWQVKPSGLCNWCPCFGNCPATSGERR